MEVEARGTFRRVLVNDARERFDDSLNIGRLELIFPAQLHKDIGFRLAGNFIAVVVDELEVGRGPSGSVL